MNKSFIKQIIPSSLLLYRQGLAQLKKQNPDCSNFEILFKSRLIMPRKNCSAVSNYASTFSKVVKSIKPLVIYGYFYPYDPWVKRMMESIYEPITSITVDYSTILNSNLEDVKERLAKCSNKEFAAVETSLVERILNFASSQSSKLALCYDIRENALSVYLSKMLYNKPNSLDEALQKILFYNGLFWQMNHWHNGLGRLDLILEEYYQHDLANGIITRESAKEMLTNFVKVLGYHTKQKSLSLIGDTGQYILLGGIDQRGLTVQNDLTEIFLEIFTEWKTPDPKLILRVNKQTNDVIWQKAVNCIKSGSGSPLIMNERLVIDRMKKFGYAKEDVWNVGTSACWEPLIIGKSFDQNNPLPSITIMKSLNNAILKSPDNCTFEDIINSFKQEASMQIKLSIRDVLFDVSPLYSLFFDSCIKREKDYTRGGADYAYHGVQIISFPNLINAILNVKKYVFEEKLVTIAQCKEILSNNFEGNDDIRELFLSNELKYGNTNAEVVDLTNWLMRYLSDEVAKYTINGKKVKMGFSSPQYITNRGIVKTSLDGRKDYEPFAVHISPVSYNIDIQEIMDFAGSLDYNDNRLNGNVVDFILPTSYVQNPNKLISILKNAMTTGVFELQLNILDKDTLIDAKSHPERYPNLIVRVWGFSAYFNDLPEVYKDNLIQRAEKYNAN